MGWTVLGASVAGTSHRQRSVPCQDAFRARVFGHHTDWLAIAVADGAGSAALAEVGAALACDTLVGMAEALPLDSPIDEREFARMFVAAREVILAEALRREVEPRQLACTAMLAILGPTTSVFGQIGDGAMVVRSEGLRWVVFWPEPGEYANLTDFLTDENWRDRLRVEIIGDAVDEFAALTDGLQRVALDCDYRTAFAGFFDPLFRDLRAAPDPEPLAAPLRDFLDSARVNGRTDDDKTLVLAVRRP